MKPICSECGKEFRTQAIIRRHINRLHTKNPKSRLSKGYECNDCPKEYKKQDTLTRHIARLQGKLNSINSEKKNDKNNTLARNNKDEISTGYPEEKQNEISDDEDDTESQDDNDEYKYLCPVSDCLYISPVRQTDLLATHLNSCHGTSNSVHPRFIQLKC